MTSKEALDEMFDLLNYEQTGICGDKNLYRIIAQDLDHLEMLEKQNKLLNETKDSVYKVLEDLGKINEENTKLKKAIKILKNKLNLNVEETFFPPAYNDMSDYGEYDWYLNVFDEFIDLQYHEYELLKEVLDNG